MTQKIEWYKEVLDIEPTSRIFFPLAKLYAASGRYKEALETLRLGLSNHPDLLEARLFLVEVLVAMDMTEATNVILNEIGTMFSRYPAFWNAWSEFMEQDPKLKDAAMALRLFAAALLGKTVSWNTIMERGITASLATAKAGGDTENFFQAREDANAITAQKNLQKNENSSTSEQESNAQVKAPVLNAVHTSVPKQDTSSAKATEPESASFRVQTAENSEAQRAVLQGKTMQQTGTQGKQTITDPTATEKQLPTSETPQASAQAKHIATKPAQSPMEQDTTECKTSEAPQAVAHAEQVIAEVLHRETQAEASTPEAPQAIQAKQAVPQAKDTLLDISQTGQETLQNAQDITTAPTQGADAASDSISVAPRQPVAVEDLPIFEDAAFVPPVASVVFDDEDLQEEPFSLRTRTMADILAEQGDIAGALDIYNELMLNAGEEDKVFLQQRIDELSVKGGSHDQPLPGEDSERLAALLMSLAQRLDIRAAK